MKLFDNLLDASTHKNNNFSYEKIKKLHNYIKNHREGVMNLPLHSSISKSHTEGQISYLIKSTFGDGRKIYSKESIENMLNIKMLKTNGFSFSDIFSIYYFDKYMLKVENDLYKKNKYSIINYIEVSELGHLRGTITIDPRTEKRGSDSN